MALKPLMADLHKRTLAAAGVALPVMVIAACLAGAALGAADATDAQIETAAARALDWIDSHPASPDDGGLADIIDECVAFSVLQDLAHTPAQRQRFRQDFSRRIVALHALPEFERWVTRPHKSLIEHYHLVLAARLAELAGHSGPLIARIKAQAAQALAMPSREPPTVRLTTALLLTRLNDPPGIDLAPLLSDSLIARLARDRHFITLPGAGASAQQRHSATWLVYALVHEVIALTDFGRAAPSPWLSARREAVLEVLLDALPWASARQDPDLVGELVVTLRMLEQPLNAPLRTALEQLLESQRADGSWGASNTTSRHNKVRHAVLTGGTALLAWLAWRELP